MPTYENAPTKRTPIRGLQFFVPTTGWYCKICFVWMGDLHCASLHLKSQTHAERYQEYAAQNPSFEVDWMSDRQRAYEHKLESGNSEAFATPTKLGTLSAMITPSSSVSISDGIPLQIQLKSHAGSTSSVLTPTPSNSEPPQSEEKKSKKKKRKQDDRKEKRKKKRSKKRKHQSSSSSSSSDSTESDQERSKSPLEKSKEDASHSIRVAMRNLLKQQNEEKIQMEESAGKWTVVQTATVSALVPPPPTISANGAESKKKDDLMIAEWNEPEPLINDKDKKLLEQIKGKVKNNQSSERADREAAELKASQLRREDSREDRRRVSRERSRNQSLERGRDRNDRGRGGRRSRSRGRRSRSRGRRSRSRSRSRSAGRYGRRRSRSRSRSRNRSRVEKPIVRYPEFRPRVPEPEKKKRGDDDHNIKSEKKLAMAMKKAAAPVSSKKLPFIGRMPVFKKQTTGENVYLIDGSSDLLFVIFR